MPNKAVDVSTHRQPHTPEDTKSPSRNAHHKRGSEGGFLIHNGAPGTIFLILLQVQRPALS